MSSDRTPPAVGMPAAPPLPADLEALLRRMRFPYMRTAAPDILATAKAQRWDPAEVIKTLLLEEVTGRERSALRTRRTQAGFPTGKTFDAWHLVATEAEIRRTFRWTFNPVEFYVQTAVWNSDFCSRVFDADDPYHSNMRLIDFKRGNGRGSPHTWRSGDFKELIESDRLFARKFDPRVDREIIDRICSFVGHGT